MILYILQDEALPAAIAEVFLFAANGTLGMPEQLRHPVFGDTDMQLAVASLIKGAS
jgi:hypothetical protein